MILRFTTLLYGKNLLITSLNEIRGNNEIRITPNPAQPGCNLTLNSNFEFDSYSRFFKAGSS